MMHLNAFTQITPHSQAIGQWKHPEDQMASGYLDLDVWVKIAKTLEKGCLDALFIADIHGFYDGYGSNRDAAVRNAVQSPAVDPMLLISALALNTKHLGIGCTYSTSYHPPYECARAFTSLDHFTNGRVGWNIVTSYVKNVYENGLGEMLDHDARYDKAEEYMEVVYKLWESSWENDAVVQDTVKDIHTDPSKVHEINHEGDFFSVKGPHMCEPSIQRTPFLFQAGASPKGIDFAAKHAEGVLVRFDSPEHASKRMKLYKDKMESYGRDPNNLKFMMTFTPVIGETESEANKKNEEFMKYQSDDGLLALFGGHTGIDLKGLDRDKPLSDMDSDGMQFIAKSREGMTINNMIADMPKSRMVGTPAQIADILETYYEAGVDGFNALTMIQPGSHEDLVNMLVPELQNRGLFRKKYEASTLREHFFGKGATLTTPDHPASQYRNKS
ncbi:MAG: LLM class flavin-dependent oxidoreductase [SAR202 cluster bacterium]|nr:LLM class flavin-dependent oxidoreductase [SAR202 cluster bacterium]|tara:strand:- start:1258 stop:2586 length:1329 start_codon:yes stop_codon:yes gene_type:complete